MKYTITFEVDHVGTIHEWDTDIKAAAADYVLDTTKHIENVFRTIEHATTTLARTSPNTARIIVLFKRK